jgi:hypothetical protein
VTGLALAALLCVSPASAGEAAAVPAGQASGARVNMSLIEGLNAIGKPELVGVFAYVAEQYAPYAFGDLLVRDRGALRDFADKVRADMKAANGLTDWDHAVCAVVVNAITGASTPSKPKKKTMSAINECVLSPVLTLQEIAARRKR